MDLPPHMDGFFFLFEFVCLVFFSFCSSLFFLLKTKMKCGTTITIYVRFFFKMSGDFFFLQREM